jgi:hypothetical protein
MESSMEDEDGSSADKSDNIDVYRYVYRDPRRITNDRRASFVTLASTLS